MWSFFCSLAISASEPEPAVLFYLLLGFTLNVTFSEESLMTTQGKKAPLSRNPDFDFSTQAFFITWFSPLQEENLV